MCPKHRVGAYLNAWKSNPNRSPLVIKDSCQTGKVETIDYFATHNYRSTVEVSFAEKPKYRTTITDGYGANTIVRNISLIDPAKKFAPGDMLVFFSGIQIHPDITTALKFFKVDGKYDATYSDSMLGVSCEQIESNSAGYRIDYKMQPLGSEEFLWARGCDEVVIGGMFTHPCDATPFSGVGTSIFSTVFIDCYVLDGMPAVVASHIRTGIFEGTLQLQRQSILDYQEDIRKYAQGLDQARILNMFGHIPVQFAKKDKKFQVSKVISEARFKDYRRYVEWFETSRVVNTCRCISYPELSLKDNCDENKLEIYFDDADLFITMPDDGTSDDLRANRNLGVYRGATYESIVSEALQRSGYDLYYYKEEDSTLKRDFFVRTREWLAPVEVKSEKGITKSARTLVAPNSYPEVRLGMKLSTNGIGSSEHMLITPYFTIFLFRRFLRAYDEGQAPMFDSPER